CAVFRGMGLPSVPLSKRRGNLPFWDPPFRRAASIDEVDWDNAEDEKRPSRDSQPFNTTPFPRPEELALKGCNPVSLRCAHLSLRCFRVVAPKGSRFSF